MIGVGQPEDGLPLLREAAERMEGLGSPKWMVQGYRALQGAAASRKK